MRKNRRRTKRMSVVAGATMHFGAVVVMLFVMVVINMLASTSCTQHERAIGEKEKEIDRLDDTLSRETMRWEEMKTPEKIEARLQKLGIKMSLPRPDQQVRLRADGRPYPGQRSVARAKRNSIPPIVQYRSRGGR